MEPVKMDQILCCDTCGVELKVIKDCDSTCVCNIICCEQAMRLKESPDERGDSSGVESLNGCDQRGFVGIISERQDRCDGPVLRIDSRSDRVNALLHGRARCRD